VRLGGVEGWSTALLQHNAQSERRAPRIFTSTLNAPHLMRSGTHRIGIATISNRVKSGKVGKGERGLVSGWSRSCNSVGRRSVRRTHKTRAFGW